jgi:hypothetical protein
METYCIRFGSEFVWVDAAKVELQIGVARYVFLDAKGEIVAAFPLATFLGYWKQSAQKS